MQILIFFWGCTIITMLFTHSVRLVCILTTPNFSIHFSSFSMSFFQGHWHFPGRIIHDSLPRIANAFCSMT